MGDRCWWHVQVPKEYVLELARHIFGVELTTIEDLDTYFDVEHTKNWYMLTDEQANYGHMNGIEAAAEAGIPFIGYHTAGCDYGATDFLSEGDGDLGWYETAHDGGGIVIYPDSDGTLLPKTFAQIRQYSAYNRMLAIVNEDKPWKS